MVETVLNIITQITLFAIGTTALIWVFLYMKNGLSSEKNSYDRHSVYASIFLFFVLGITLVFSYYYDEGNNFDLLVSFCFMIWITTSYLLNPYLIYDKK